jgi:hypothetical protein
MRQGVELYRPVELYAVPNTRRTPTVREGVELCNSSAHTEPREPI